MNRRSILFISKVLSTNIATFQPRAKLPMLAKSCPAVPQIPMKKPLK